MNLFINLYQLLLLISLSYSFQEIHKKTKVINDFLPACQLYFHGTPWPMLKDVEETGLVKLCQNRKLEDEESQILFATLFDTVSRTPIYTANVVTLSLNGTRYPRPSSRYWQRISDGICNYVNETLPLKPIQSLIERANKSAMIICDSLQAIPDDYKNNGFDLTRGHLSPNSINSQNEQKQKGTFTLTNAAPQFANFNGISWREFECVIQYAVTIFSPDEEVYIMTGTYGTALDSEGNPWWLYSKDRHEKRVKVPKYYWKAVCYPGTSEKEPWAVAVIQENANIKKHAQYEDLITLKEFASKYFDDLPFGPSCMNATFGRFATLSENWDQVVKKGCAPILLKPTVNVE